MFSALAMTLHVCLVLQNIIVRIFQKNWGSEATEKKEFIVRLCLPRKASATVKSPSPKECRLNLPSEMR